MIHTLVQELVTWIIHHGGVYMILLVLFAETGLFVGFFLPGDSLLFAAGLYGNDLAAAFFHAPFYVLLLLMAAATAAGSYLGYVVGRKAGHYFLRRKERFWFRKKHLYQAKDFYERHGRLTIFLAKFLPVIRTFAPVVGGMVRMPFRSFSLYNGAGSLCWVGLLGMAGYFLEGWVLRRFHFDLKDHIEYITLLIVLVTTLPVLIKLVWPSKPSKSAPAAAR